MVVFSFLMFKETHAPTILARRAKHFRKTTGNARYYTAVEKLDAGKSKSWITLHHLSRPIRLLMFHPIVQIQACLSGFSYGILYLVLSTFADLYTSQYHESVAISGLHYITLCLGEVVGAVVGSPLIDYFYRRLKDRADGVAVPEFRVPIMIPGYLLGPVGLFIYGWAAEKHLQWIVVDIGAFILCLAMQVGGTALQAYVIDSYPDHTSSASAATQFLRSMTAFGFPLFAQKMYSVLGYGWRNSTLAFAGLAIGIPAPLLIWYSGPKLRARMRSSH
jgi:MFS family permease